MIKKNYKQKSELLAKQNLRNLGWTDFRDDMIEFYTGFPTYELFMIFFSAIRPSAARMTSVYYTASDELSSRGRPRSMDPIDELFLFLCIPRGRPLSQI